MIFWIFIWNDASTGSTGLTRYRVDLYAVIGVDENRHLLKTLDDVVAPEQNSHLFHVTLKPCIVKVVGLSEKA